MTPIFLNPPPSPNFPFGELKEEHHDLKLYLSVNKYEAGSNDQQQASSSSSSSYSLQSTVDYKTTNGQDSSIGSAGDNNGISVKWMSSKMRLTKKKMDSDHNNTKAVKFTHEFQYPIHDYNGENNSSGKVNSNTIRVCSDCNTTSTPLWRGGPRGPKSLCNACGIRQRKARRAMEAAAAATQAENSAGVAKDAPISMKIKIQNSNNKGNKEKKSRIGQFKKQQFKAASDQQAQTKLCFKEFALSLSNNSSALQRVFPRDVEDAAILLMEISCGLIHS